MKDLMRNAKGVLYIVATPIGNLEDITLHAIATLSSVDVILCEDTRQTMKLLGRYNVKTPLLSLNARSEKGRIAHVVRFLESGKNAALVSDAGTPTISDPGSMLVSSVRTALPEISVIAIPGASAVVAALSVSGLPSSEFLFLGFLPHKKGREKLFKEIADAERTVVFYESPHRIMKTLGKLSEYLDADRRVVVARELTKAFEQVVFGSSAEVLEYFTVNKDKQRGEFVIVVGSSA